MPADPNDSLSDDRPTSGPRPRRRPLALHPLLLAPGALALLGIGFWSRAVLLPEPVDLSAPPRPKPRPRPTATPIPPPPPLPRASAQQKETLRAAFATTDAWADKYFPPRPQPSLVVCQPSAPREAQAFGDGCARWMHFQLAGSPRVGGSPMWHRVEQARLSAADTLDDKVRARFRPAPSDAQEISRATGAARVAVGRLQVLAGAPLVLSYEVRDAAGESLGTAEARGTREAITTQLPLLARKIGALAKIEADVPPRCELSARDLEVVGAPAWSTTGVAVRVPAASRGEVRALEVLAPRSALAALLCLYHWPGNSGDARYNAAQKHLLRLAPSNALAWSGAAWLYGIEGRERDLDALSRRFPNNALLCGAQAVRAARDDKSDLAARWYGQAAVLSPRDPLWWRWMGDIYSEQAEAVRGSRYAGQISSDEWQKLNRLYPLVLAASGHASRLDPRDADTWSDVATAATFASRDDVAEAALWTGLELEPRHKSLHSWALQLFQPKWMAGRQSEFDLMLQRVEADPELFGDLHLAAIGALNSAGRNPEANQMMSRVIPRLEEQARREPQNAQVQLHLAQLANRFGIADTQLDNMIARYRAYLKLVPDDAEIHYVLGQALQLRKKDVPGARAAYQAALKIKPAHAGARAALDGLPLEGGV